MTAKLLVSLSFGCRWVGFLFRSRVFLLLFGLVGLVPGLLAWSCSGFPPTPWHLIWDRFEVKASQTADPNYNNSNLLPPVSVTELSYNKVHSTLLEPNMFCATQTLEWHEELLTVLASDLVNALNGISSTAVAADGRAYSLQDFQQYY